MRFPAFQKFAGRVSVPTPDGKHVLPPADVEVTETPAVASNRQPVQVDVTPLVKVFRAVCVESFQMSPAVAPPLRGDGAESASWFTKRPEPLTWRSSVGDAVLIPTRL